MTNVRWALLLVLVVGGILRFKGAAEEPLKWIEVNEFIPASLTLSWDHLPARVSQHGALPIYLIRASSLIFGHSPLGVRVLSVLAGTATLLLVYLIGVRWWGPVAGLSAAALLAIEQYHIAISRAIDLPFDLFFVALAMFCFSRFVYAAQDPNQEPSVAGRWLYGTAGACALGFLCKEFTALLLPALLLSLVAMGHASWLRRREPWLALGLFLILIAPDLYSNFTITRDQRMELRARQANALRQVGIEHMDEDAAENGLYMSYGDQLSRFRGVGFNKEPFYFYFGTILDAVGVVHRNEFDEFPYMHPAMSVALWAAVALGLVRRKRDRFTVFLLTMFVVTFVPFALVQLGPPRATFPTDPRALWYWADRSALPALLLAGRVVAIASRRELV